MLNQTFLTNKYGHKENFHYLLGDDFLFFAVKSF